MEDEKCEEEGVNHPSGWGCGPVRCKLWTTWGWPTGSTQILKYWLSSRPEQTHRKHRKKSDRREVNKLWSPSGKRPGASVWSIQPHIDLNCAVLTEELMILLPDLSMMILRMQRYRMMEMRNITTTATCTQEVQLTATSSKQPVWICCFMSLISDFKPFCCLTTPALQWYFISLIYRLRHQPHCLAGVWTSQVRVTG